MTRPDIAMPMQPTFVEVDEGLLKSALLVCESSIDNAASCLNEATELTFISKNRLNALQRMYTEEINRALALRESIRKLLGIQQ